jgi:hypothetical protein
MARYYLHGELEDRLLSARTAAHGIFQSDWYTDFGEGAVLRNVSL